MSFEQFGAREMYLRVEGLGDRLALMKKQISWEQFRPLVASVFRDNKTEGGRPHTDELLIIRALLLQEWYGLSDEELEFQCNDRLSFRHFLGFPEKVPDFSTIWKIRDRLRECNVDKKIWEELQRQMDEKGYKVSKGVVQDASFINAEPGKSRRAKEWKAEKEGRTIDYTPKQLSHIDKEGTFAVKNHKTFFGYKLHVKTDVKNLLIRECEVTTASRHDSQINLVENFDGVAYRDKGYFGTVLPEGVVDRTMQRATKCHELTELEKKRNFLISRIRSPSERPFSVIKNVFHSGVVYVTTTARVLTKKIFTCFAYNLYQLVTLHKKNIAIALNN